MPTIYLTDADVTRLLALPGSPYLPGMATFLTGDMISQVHHALHADAATRGVDLYYRSGDDLHDRLSDVVFDRVWTPS